MLGANGLVYNISNPEKEITGLSEIAKVSCGTEHCVALNVYGSVYAWGTNTYGECGTGTSENVVQRYIGTNIRDISAGNQISILESNTGKVYVFRK